METTAHEPVEADEEAFLPVLGCARRAAPALDAVAPEASVDGAACSVTRSVVVGAGDGL